MSGQKKYILTEETVSKKIARLALEIIENNIEEQEIYFVGIEGKGLALAKKIREQVMANSAVNVQLITLKMNKTRSEPIELSQSVNYNGKVVIVIDDVTNSGRTLLYALKPFLEFHPKKIRTLVLVERTHTLFPVSPDYKGVSLATTLQEHITVEVENDKITGAFLD